MKRNPPPLRRLLLTLLLTLPALPGFAQDDKRREFIEGLFRTIIESRSQRNQAPEPSVPGQQFPGGPFHPAPPASPNPNPNQLVLYRSLIASYFQQTDALANKIGQDSIRLPELRSYLPELVSLRSQALRLQQNSNTVGHLAHVEPEFRALDTAWRDLSFRLQASSSLDTASRQSVNTIEEYGRKLCDLFGIEADFDRTRAVFLAGQASAYTGALTDVLQEQLTHLPNSQQLIQEGRQVMGLARQFGLNVVHYSLPQAIEACEDWGNAWMIYAAKLQMYQDPSLTLPMTRIGRTLSEIYELMRIQRPIDYRNLQLLTSQTQGVIQSLFNQLGVRMTGRFLNQGQIQALSLAQGQVSNQFLAFQNSLQGTIRHDQVLRNFSNFEGAWRNCDQYLIGLPSPIANYRVAVIAQIDLLSEALQVSGGLDMSLSLTRAAELEALANSLYISLAQRAQFIPNTGYRNQDFLVTQQFLQYCTIFHAQVANGSDPATLQATCGNLVDSWQNCSQTIRGFPARGVQSEVYQSLERICSEIDPAVAELAVFIAP